MSSEGFTLYKLIVLYMLDRVDFPLTNSQISQFILDKGYTNYFILQQAINELIEAEFMRSELIRNTTHYNITKNGCEALEMFSYMLPEPIKEDILDYFNTQKINLRNEVEIYAKYYPAMKDDYTVECVIKEHQDTLLELKLNVATLDQAVSICDTWKDKSTDIYSYLINHLWNFQ